MAPVLGVAAVVTSDGGTGHAPRRERVIGALVQLGSATTAKRHHTPRWSLPPRDDMPADAVLAQVEEALAEEVAQSEAFGAPAGRLRPLEARLIELRVAREQLRFAATVERYHDTRQHAVEEPSGRPAAEATGADGTIGRARLRRLPHAPRVVTPGLLGLLVNAVA